MWKIEPVEGGWDKDHKKYEKKRPTELAAVLRNLKRYQALLETAKNSRSVQAGFLHFEPMGVVAVDQKGGGPHLQETRLYTYADDSTQTLYLIAIGDKDGQHSDIEYCKAFVHSIRDKETPTPTAKKTT